MTWEDSEAQTEGTPQHVPFPNATQWDWHILADQARGGLGFRGQSMPVPVSGLVIGPISKVPFIPCGDLWLCLRVASFLLAVGQKLLTNV